MIKGAITAQFRAKVANFHSKLDGINRHLAKLHITSSAVSAELSRMGNFKALLQQKTAKLNQLNSQSISQYELLRRKVNILGSNWVSQFSRVQNVQNSTKLSLNSVTSVIRTMATRVFPFMSRSFVQNSSVISNSLGSLRNRWSLLSNFMSRSSNSTSNLMSRSFRGAAGVMSRSFGGASRSSISNLRGVGGAAAGLPPRFGSQFGLIKSLVIGLTSQAVNTASGHFYSFGNINLYSIGQSIISGLIGGVRSMAGSLLSQVYSMAGSIKSAFSSALSIRSPSKYTLWIGQMLGEGLTVGMRQSQLAVRGATKDMSRNVTRTMTSTLTKHNVTNNNRNITNNINVNSSNSDVRKILEKRFKQSKFAATGNFV